jgi:hypothetical protein
LTWEENEVAMKLNENGDFCLLFVEATDEKERLFEVIGAQKKPVVLLLPQVAGQPRSRLFQRPEDFSDLKHVRRQTGVPIIFLTASSELLAQMAARHGFPSYPSVDAFASMLAQERSPGLVASGLYSQAGRRARTGPLVPTAGQVAAIRRSMPAVPLREQADDLPWPLPAGSIPPVEYSVSMHAAQTLPPPALPPMNVAVWPGPLDHAVWDASAALAGARATPIPPARGNSSAVLPTTPVPGEPFATDEQDVPPWHVSEVARRRSAQPLDEPHSHHPGWSALTTQMETSARPSQQVSGSGVPAPQVPAVPVLTSPPEAQASHQRRSILPVLITLSLLILAGAGLGSFVALLRITPAVPAIAIPVGSLTFLSSEQLNENTSQGIDDEVQINLHSLGSPAPGKSYYAWLLGDKDQLESRTILLGKLNVVNGGAIHQPFPGNRGGQQPAAAAAHTGYRKLALCRDAAGNP